MAQELLHGGGDDALSAAIGRLDQALTTLEGKLAARPALSPRDGPLEDDLFQSDHTRLTAELHAARAREKALEAVAAEASAALGRAAAEVRAALSAEEG